jgi:hypothetical protein
MNSKHIKTYQLASSLIVNVKPDSNQQAAGILLPITFTCSFTFELLFPICPSWSMTFCQELAVTQVNINVCDNEKYFSIFGKGNAKTQFCNDIIMHYFS